MNTLVTRLRLTLSVALCVVAAGTLAFMKAEHLSFRDALYFTIVTVTTVGYGDICPKTGLGRMLAIALILLGVGTFLAVVANVTELLIERRARADRMEKMNIMVGLFCSEMGNWFLRFFGERDGNRGPLAEGLRVSQAWKPADFARARKMAGGHHPSLSLAGEDLAAMRDFLAAKSDLLMRFLENPNLLEHEAFTALLQAVMHLREELAARTDLTQIPEADHRHVTGDAIRAYRLLLSQWIDYMEHLSKFYPFLFSFAARTNPFDPEADPSVR